MREKRPYPSSYCTKSGRMSGMLVSGKTFPSPSKWCLTTLMTFKIPDITWAVVHSLNLYVGLQGPGWPYVLGMPPRGDVRLWNPRARATDVGQGPHLHPGVPAGFLRATDPRAREKTRRRKRKNADEPKNTFIHNNTSSSHPAVADALCLSLLPLSQIPLEYCCR